MSWNFMDITLYRYARVKALYLALLISFSGQTTGIEFNTDILDVDDRDRIDLSHFSKSGYLMPGEYRFVIRVNKFDLPEQAIFYYTSPTDEDKSDACLPPSLVEQFGLKHETVKTLKWWREGQCLALESLPGSEAKADLAESTLYINIPQAYLEYTADNWDPPSRWDDGIPGMILDYNFNTQISQQIRGAGKTTYSLDGNGIVGANLGAWRARADWQTRLDKGQGQASTRSLEWSRYYVYRAIKSLGVKLSLGENYLTSDVFDSFRFIGISVVTDANMLPPTLRGYAPEITGVAQSNATVIVSQQGRIIYQTQVAAGPFRIQDLSDAMTGELNVEVKEQDGSVQNFTVNTASIPYLTRPGQIRYKLSVGRPTDWHHHTNGDLFGGGEFSWGINNGWSLFGGAIASKNYFSSNLGVGRDLMVFGALSFDITHSRATLKELLDSKDNNHTGNSYRFSYSKRFDAYDSQVTFAGYRFSEKGFMSMSEYLSAQTAGIRSYRSKEMYTISYNQRFSDLGVSSYLNYDRQTYWDRPSNDRFSVSLSKYFDIGQFKNLSVNLTAYRQRNQNRYDDGAYISLSLPWGLSSYLSMDSSWNSGNSMQRIGYYDRLNERSSYQLNSGISDSGAMINGFYSYEGDIASTNANASYQHDQYRSAGMSIRGGLTATQYGAALHRNNQSGGTRIFVETDGIPDIPLRGYGATVKSNQYGQAVLTDINSYYRSPVSVDLNTLPDDAQVTHSVKQGTLTEGAIGYRHFDVIAGGSAMASLRLADHNPPPFGAVVINSKGMQIGIVGDDGLTYLIGLKPEDVLQVQWDQQTQCEVTVPAVLPTQEDLPSHWVLPCNSVEDGINNITENRTNLSPRQDEIQEGGLSSSKKRWLIG